MDACGSPASVGQDGRTRTVMGRVPMACGLPAGRRSIAAGARAGHAIEFDAGGYSSR